MKIAKKIRVILLLVFCCFFALGTNVKAEEWILTPVRQNTGYRFECGNYADQNYLSVDKFCLNSTTTGEQRRAYCIQKRVITAEGKRYYLQEFDINTLSISDMISTYSWGDGQNTSINYYNDLNENIRKSLNIASMWEKTYHYNEDAAIVATQWFVWAQTTGYSSAFQENQAHDPKTPLARREDGYRFLDMNYGTWNTDTNNNGIFSAKGILKQPHGDNIDSDGDGVNDGWYESYWDINLTNTAAQRYIELVNYYENFKDNLMPNFVQTAGTDNIIYPGETIRYTDTNGVFNLAEYDINMTLSNLPTGVNVSKQGNDLVISVSSNFSGYFKGNIIIERFGKNNPEVSRWYSNGTHQILFEGALPKSDLTLPIEVVSMKAKVIKSTESTTGNKGDSELQGAVYGIYSDRECKNLVTSITTDANGEATTGYLPGTLFYAKEITEPTGTLLNNTVYVIDINEALKQPDGTLLVTFDAVDDIIEGNLKILKRLGETDYDPEINLNGAQFKVTLKNDPSQEYLTTISGEDGICKLENIPYGTYTVTEYITPDEAYTIEPFDVFVSDEGYTYEYTKIDDSKEMKIAVNKVLLDETVGKTDAKVSGAYFTVYLDENATQEYVDKNGNPVIIGPTDNTGYAVSGTMRTGTYYLKETTFPEGINPDAMVPGEDVSFKDKVYVASYDNKKQGEDIIVVSLEKLINIPNLGRVRVMKYEDNPDSTVESPAAGAVLRLTLDSSDGQVYYDATVNKYGYAEFRNEDLAEYDPYTIPYGKYTITEIKEDDDDEHNHFFIQAEKVEIVNEKDIEDRIVSDEPTPAWLRIVKKDKITGQNVKLDGAKFKIWDVKNSKWVSLMETPSGEYIEEFETNADGYFYTPQELQPGEYVVYETQAPDGYYLEDDLRIPEDEKDLGNDKVSGYKVVVDKIATGLEEDAVYPEGGIATGSLVIEVPVKDTPLTVNLEIYKTGERFVDTNSENITYPISDSEDATEEKFTPIFKEVGIEGAKFKVYAVEDTYTPDGILRYKKGQVVADITTNSEGYATAEKLFPGEYRIEEYETSEGLVINKEIRNVVLENKDQYKETVTFNENISNDRQKLQLTFNKLFEDVNYANGEKLEKKALFGIYTKEVIKNYKEEETIPNNKLVDLIWADEDGDVTSTIDLPEGTYYVKELYASYPYTISTETVDFVLKYTDDSNQEFVVVEGPDFTNDYESASITLVKLSATTMDNIILNGDKIDTTTLDEEVQAILDQIKGMTKEEIKEYFEKNEVKFVSGAKYGVYTDEDCTKALRIKNEETGVFEEAVIVTDDTGLVELNNIPLGEYYLKEIEAPQGYELSDEIVKVTLDNTNKDTMVYQALIEEEVIESFLIKTDIFTGELIPNCIFEIRDENDELLLRSITDEEGKGYIPVSMFEDGKTYTYTEVEAPDIYDLNKEPHEFVAKYDEEGNWDVEPVEVENIRKTREVIVRKLDAETGEPLKGCVFTIAMIDPETGEQKVNAKTGEPIYLVENVETDENGEYIIPEAPMGTYKFLEIKAPEGYELDEDLTGYTFTIDNNSPETIIFEVTNTGDIAVIAIASVAVICVVGIVVVIIRNKKKQ